MAKTRLTLQERFMQYVELEPMSGCWLWTAATNYGYGVMSTGKRVGGPRISRAHRVAWEMFRGPIPDGLFVCHRCDVRACVNPDHLFLGTNHENCLDMAAKKRGTHSPAGLPRGVRRHRRRFQAIVHIHGRDHYIGSFRTIEEASVVSDRERSRMAAEPAMKEETSE